MLFARWLAALLYAVAPQGASSPMVAATIVVSITGVATLIPFWQALSVQLSHVLK